MYLVEADNFLKTLFFRNRAYCSCKTSDKKTNLFPLNPQPTSNDILKIQHYYCTLKASSVYRKRVTRVLQAPAKHKQVKQPFTSVAVVENIGRFPGLLHPVIQRVPNEANYIRTVTATMDIRTSFQKQ